jgi:hypothetical protein
MLAVSVGIVLAVPAPAQAATIWQLDDGFELTPETFWSFEGVGADFGELELSEGMARSGSNNAHLGMLGSGWSAVRQSVRLTPVQIRPSDCIARIFVRPVTSTVTVNLEIIEPSSWGYIALKTVTLSGSTYQAVTTDVWHAVHANVVVRLSVIGGAGLFTLRAARVDDLTLQCAN